MLKIGIIGAMEVEVAYLVKIMQDSKKTEVKLSSGLLSFYEGTIKGTSVVVVQSGVGKVNAAMCATLLITKFNITHLMNTGVAGGLQQGLHIFDIVVSTDAVHHDFDATDFGYAACTIPGMKSAFFEADKTLRETALKAYAKGGFSKKIVEGRIATGDVFVNSPERKEQICKLCNPACVEMEGAAVAQVSYQLGIPFLIIRCISDMAENTNEVYHEEEAAKYSSFLVETMMEMLAENK